MFYFSSAAIIYFTEWSAVALDVVSWFCQWVKLLLGWVMAEINADVLAQMHRIHVATNDGTFNKDVINDALRMLHDFLSGAAYEKPDPTLATEEVAVEVEAHPHKARSHKKKR